jgi:membrane protein implicated in regulation of membrane protease activity
LGRLSHFNIKELKQMTIKNRPAAFSFATGIVVCILGALTLCYCPWMFAIAATAFGVAAATAESPRWRWAAVIAIAISVAMAIQEATEKERVRAHALRLEKTSEVDDAPTRMR